MTFEVRTGVMNQLERDPECEITISVPEHLLDDFASAIAIDIDIDDPRPVP